MKILLAVAGDKEEERLMNAQDKTIHDFTPAKMKWWYWPMLILGSVMIIGGTVWVIVS